MRFNRFFGLNTILSVLLGVSMITNAQATAQALLEFELGVAKVSANNIQVPGDAPEATDFNANTVFSTSPRAAYRTRAGYRFADRHNVFGLAAPLTARYTGSPGQDINFKGQTYAAGEDTELDYTFNSYRLTYRYDIVQNDNWQVGLGLTGKIRDAAISMRSADGDQWARTSDFGFVPLINLHLAYSAIDDWWLSLNGDGLVNPFSPSVGRAFDYRLAIEWTFMPKTTAFAGYRFVEGGADVDQVYNFAWVNYGVVGLSYGF